MGHKDAWLSLLAWPVPSWCIYDFVCSPPCEALPGRSPCRIVINAFNYPSNGHWMLRSPESRGPTHPVMLGPARHSSKPCCSLIDKWRPTCLLVSIQFSPLQKQSCRFFFNFYSFAFLLLNKSLLHKTKLHTKIFLEGTNSLQGLQNSISNCFSFVVVENNSISNGLLLKIW